MQKARLSPPRTVRIDAELPRRRRHGFLRRLERRFSHHVTSKFFFHIPGIHRIYGWALRRSLRLSEVEVGIPGLEGSLEGLRLLLITDVHAGPFIDTSLLRETFDRLLSLEPDAVLLGGDLTGGKAKRFLHHREAFAALHAPLGVYAVLGNHDYYDDRLAPLRAMLDECGIELLTNRSVRLARGGGELTLAGVDDLQMGSPDLDAALRGARPPLVLLSHNPDLLFEAARRGVALMLSGHTHGGQVRIPGLPLMLRQSVYRLDGGRYRAGETQLLVSRGLGVVGLPFRIGCPPEVVLLTLKKKKGDRFI